MLLILLLEEALGRLIAVGGYATAVVVKIAVTVAAVDHVISVVRRWLWRRESLISGIRVTHSWQHLMALRRRQRR